jgi:hypothetical protein
MTSSCVPWKGQIALGLHGTFMHSKGAASLTRLGNAASIWAAKW